MTVSEIFNIKSNDEFYNKVFEVFTLQYNSLPIYQQFCNSLHRTPTNVNHINEIPFLPIQFFRTHNINIKGSYDIVFESSGTTNSNTSKHFVADELLYQLSLKKTFEYFYGNATDYLWLALLPSLHEKNNSSLAYMINYFVNYSKHNESGFYLNKHESLYQTLLNAFNQNKKVILFGLSYALLDFAEKYKLPHYDNLIVMETGGMKGKRKEMVRQELHTILKDSFNVKQIHSEYGMTELLSQSYSKSNGIFVSPPWMKVLIRDVYDPLNVGIKEKNGGVNIIDLANIYSCSFIETEDMGFMNKDGSFEIHGRLQNTISRGCNMLI